jgi:hypothetical protein
MKPVSSKIHSKNACSLGRYLILLLVLSFVACEQKPASEKKNIFSAEINAMKKTKQVEEIGKQHNKRMREQLDKY